MRPIRALICGLAVALWFVGASLHSQPEPRPGEREFALKVLEGARKEVANRTVYHEEYHVLAYPGGDVPSNQGVCTDLVIRAFRHAGVDLQKELHEDRVANPKAYPTQIWSHKKADKNIDHRRCQNLTVWFKRHARSLPTSIEKQDLANWQAGDVVFFVREGKSHPWHVAVISDKKDANGIPLLIDGYPPYTGEVRTLSELAPIFSHFRYVPAPAAEDNTP